MRCGQIRAKSKLLRDGKIFRKRLTAVSSGEMPGICPIWSTTRRQKWVCACRGRLPAYAAVRFHCAGSGFIRAASQIVPLKHLQKLMHQIEIRAITGAETWPLRLKVLRPGHPPAVVQFEGDDLPETKHFGAFLGGLQLVGIASLFFAAMPQRPEYRALQLRGMATAPEARGCGCGRARVRVCRLRQGQRGGLALVQCAYGRSRFLPEAELGNCRQSVRDSRRRPALSHVATHHLNFGSARKMSHRFSGGAR